MRHAHRWLAVLLVAAALAALPLAAVAQVRTLNVASLADFSGPYADVMKPLIAGRNAALDWWNAEVGAKLGVKLNYKAYDTRYDTAQVASLWPGIKSELNPVAVMGLGGPDVADTLAAVLKSDPNWKALPTETPEPVRRLLRRCLAKSPNERLADASAARLDLEDARHAPPTAPPARSRNGPGP